MSKTTEIKGAKGTITLKQFISMGKTIADIYKDNEEKQKQSADTLTVFVAQNKDK